MQLALVFEKRRVVFEETTRRFSDFVGYLFCFVGRKIFFFPWNFENVPRKMKNLRQNWENL